MWKIPPCESIPILLDPGILFFFFVYLSMSSSLHEINDYSGIWRYPPTISRANINSVKLPPPNHKLMRPKRSAHRNWKDMADSSSKLNFDTHLILVRYIGLYPAFLLTNTRTNHYYAYLSNYYERTSSKPSYPSKETALPSEIIYNKQQMPPSLIPRLRTMCSKTLIPWSHECEVSSGNCRHAWRRRTDFTSTLSAE